MSYGTKYIIQRSDTEIVMGTEIQTRGNDEDFPTFVLEDGSQFGCARSRVLGEVVEPTPQKKLLPPSGWKV